MSEFFTTLDSWSESWLDWLVSRSLVFAIACAVIVPAAAWLGRRRVLSAHAVSFAVLLPALLLVLPLERWLPTSWPAALPASLGEIAAVDAANPPDETSNDAALPRVDEAPLVVPSIDSSSVAEPRAGTLRDDRYATEEAPTAPSLRSLAMLGWSLGLAVFLARLLIRQRSAERFLLETSHPVDPELRSLLDACAASCGIRRRVRLRLSDELPSPATTGVLRPVVYLPAEGTLDLPRDQLRFVLLHELTHVRRLDQLTDALLRCLRAAFVFHPAAWITLAFASRWRELACDEAALARIGSTDRTPGAQALLTLAAPARALARDRLAVAHLLNDVETMKTRIERLLDLRQVPRTGLDARGVFAATALCGLAMTAARAQEAHRTEPEAEVVEIVEDIAEEIVEIEETPEQSAIEVAIRRGTRWLLTRQEANGRFGLGEAPKGKPRDHNDAFATGIAIQALIPEFDGPDGDRARDAAGRAAGWLISVQDDKGKIGGNDPLTMAYGHAQALRALSMLQQRAPSDSLREAIEAGVQYAEYHRNPYAGWRYGPRDGDNDSKITGLMLLALLEAQRAGVELPKSSIELGRLTLENLTDPETGRTGFVQRGSPMSRFVWKNEDFPRKYSEEPSALNLLVAFECGDDLLEKQIMQRAVSLLAAMPPKWSREKGSIDYSYWQFGAEAIARVPGFQRQIWRRRIATELAERQSESGYWPAVDAWSAAGMENWSTATALVALQALR